MQTRIRWVMLAAMLSAACVPAGGGGDDDEAPADVQPRDTGATLLDMAADAAAGADAAMEADGSVEADAAMEADAGPRAACDDGLDNDRDGRVDFPDDPGCDGPDDDDEADPAPPPGCDDGLDNDGDGRVDAADPDCTGPADPTEAGGNAPTACSDEADNDGDGLVDFPADPGCIAAGHNTEADPLPLPACANGEDDDGDGLIDYPAEPGCAGRGDESEDDPVPAPECANGVDDDGNGAADHPDDSGCDAAGDRLEQSPCGADVPLVDLNGWLAANDAYEADLAGLASSLVGSCGGAAGGEVAFAYTVDGPLDALIFDTRHPETTAPVVMYLRQTCQGGDTQCDRGSIDDPGTSLTVLRPPPGQLILVVDAGSRQQIGAFKLTVEAIQPPACRNMADDDGDGLVDLTDPGCEETEDGDEADPPEPPACANGVDDDGDGATDYPDDPDCVAAGGVREAPPCRLDAPYVFVGQEGGEVELPIAEGAGVAQGRCDPAIGAEALIVLTLSEPSDVTIDVVTAAGLPGPGSVHVRSVCDDIETERACRRTDVAEPLALTYLDRGTWFIFAEQGFVRPAEPLIARITIDSRLGACNDLVDNDADGLTDLDDPGCADGADGDEVDPPEPPECSDGIDNDRDGAIDYPADEGCAAAGDPEESPLCDGQLYGELCLVHLSASCQNGSARQYCQQFDARVVTFQEFQDIVAQGWTRPDGGYHTLAVEQFPACANEPNGAGNCGIPGWGNFNLFRCGDDQNYCARAIMCVR